MPLDGATKLSGLVIGAAQDVQRALGPGLAGHLYQRALGVELRSRNLHVRHEFEVQVSYRGVAIGLQRLDLVVFEQHPLIALVVEVTHLHADDYHRMSLKEAQCATYLAAALCRVGLVLNFGTRPLGIARVLNPNIRSQTP